jgi:hypothetical protein
MSYPAQLSNPAQANAPVVANENGAAIAALALYARNYVTSTGLVLGYYGGHIAGSSIADGTTTLAASEANVYVVAHRTTGAVTSATNTTNWNATGTYGRLYHAVTGGSTITSLTDWRGQAGGWFDRAGSVSVDADDVTYTPTTLADWDGAADPGDVEQALDQLAERVADVEAGGGGDASTTTYTPTTVADWDGSTDPGNVDDALDQLAERITDVEAAGAGPSVASRYVIDLASQADSDPGSGKLRFNHATPTSATKIFLDDETSDGVDLSTALLDFGSSGYIRIQSVDDVGEWLYAKWTAITDDTGYFDIAITVLASKGTLDDTDAVLVTFDAKGSGGAGSAGRHAVYITAGSMQPALSAGSSGLTILSVGASQPEIATLNFDATTQESAHFSLTMPKSWNEGTVTFVPIWSHASTSTNFGVVWSLRGVAFSNDDTMAASFGTHQTSTDTGGTTNDVYVGPESAAITIGGSPAAEDTVFFRVDRIPTDGSDTMAIDARLHGIVLFITTDAETDA